MRLNMGKHLATAIAGLWVALAANAYAADIERGDPGVSRERGLLHYQGEPLTSALVERGEGGLVLSRTEYLAGLKHGASERYNDQGKRRRLTIYVAGKRHGDQLSWHASGQLQSRTPYVDGLIDGVSEQFSASGQLLQRQRHRSGREEGLQQSWHEDGELAFAYVYRDGRRYGVLGSKPCFTVNPSAEVVFNEGL